MRTSLPQIWRLALVCALRPGGRAGIVQFACLLALGLIEIHLAVRLIRWTADFYNALQKLHVEAALQQTGIFFVLVGLFAVTDLAAAYIRRMLQIRWRSVLTAAMLDLWLADRAFWHLRDHDRAGLDNPDQRIAEDCRIFVHHFTTEAAELIVKIVALVSYAAILWELSTYSLAFSLFGFDLAIPRYLVWAAPIYVAVASGLTHWLGAPLVPLKVAEQKAEADFRFALARFRESGEAVALARGETAERRLFDARFRAVAGIWRDIARREFVMGLFGRPYFRTVLRIPLFLALPAYLAGKVTFGGLMQLASALQNVVTTLSWFIFSYRDLAELASAAARLDRFAATVRAAGAAPSGIAVQASPDGGLRLTGLRLAAADGRAIAAPGDIVLARGTTVWIKAPSGFGKSTLLRALAGLWRHGGGRIETPAGGMSFLPQQAYLPLGGVEAAAVYPAEPGAVPAATIASWLAAVGLGRLAGLSAADAPAALAGLSGGERQRLALVRLAAERPAWAFLDEPVSALDETAERQLMEWLRRELPETTFVVVAHRRPVGLGEVHVLDLAVMPPVEAAAGARGLAAAASAG